MITFLILCLLNSSIKSTGVHFIALGVGICLSIGFMPYISENNWKNKVSMIFKFIVGILVVIPIVIILVH
jgi:ABC-type phosphate transport system permease subunit